MKLYKAVDGKIKECDCIRDQVEIMEKAGWSFKKPVAKVEEPAKKPVKEPAKKTA